MNNDLKCLNKTLEDHLLWLSSNGSKGKQADFRNQNLSGTNLYNISLAYANLANANLTNANLTNANLQNANLENASLAYANLIGANLIGANLTYTNLYYAYLTSTNLENANLENVKGVQVFKCFYVENNEKKFNYFFNSTKAKKEMSKRLANRQCSWVE